MNKELAKNYDPKDIEDRLYEKWLNKKYFHAKVDKKKKPFAIVMPPPNITGQLHMGHALDNTLQDILIRFKRTVGSVYITVRSFITMYRADGTLLKVRVIFNRLKPVVTKSFEPTALKREFKK